ncbi:MAG TPA: response regulator [Anaerolineae bacterium]|nr:response regulator [Anaerolineae bacterium]
MHQETILVIDDNVEFARALINYMLIPLNFNALHATDGQIGLKIAVDQNPDVIMLDMHMPLMSGLEVLTALRRQAVNAPVIFMTAEGSENIAIDAFRQGVRDYLIKPFDKNGLSQALDRALRETRLEQDALVSETVRRTVVTLSHYLNNYLMVLDGNLFLLEEELQEQRQQRTDHLLEILKDSKVSADKIKKVINVLQRVSKVKMSTYHGHIKMVDIEAALRQEFGE